MKQRVESTSLRGTSREIGITSAGLLKFLRGAEPYTATRRKLELWYGRQPPESGAEQTPNTGHALVAALVQDLPPKHRLTAQAALVRALEDAYRTSGCELPPWLRGIREKLEKDAGKQPRRRR